MELCDLSFEVEEIIDFIASTKTKYDSRNVQSKRAVVVVVVFMETLAAT